MATERGTVEFLLEQMQGAGPVTARAMFGEYGLYLQGRMVALVCDDRLFLRDLPATRARMTAPERAAPYPGAKDWLLVEAELDEPEALAELVRLAWEEAPPPKRRR